MQTRCNSVYYVNVPGDVFVRVSSAFHEAFWRRQVSKTWLKECQDNWIQRRPAMLCTTVVKDHYLLFLRSLLEVSVLKLNKESTFFSLVKFDNKLILFIFSKKKKAKLVLYDREIAFGIYELLWNLNPNSFSSCVERHNVCILVEFEMFQTTTVFTMVGPEVTREQNR